MFVFKKFYNSAKIISIRSWTRFLSIMEQELIKQF